MAPPLSDNSWSAGIAPYFEHDYAGPAFVLFGPGHLAALAVLKQGTVTFGARHLGGQLPGVTVPTSAPKVTVPLGASL